MPFTALRAILSVVCVLILSAGTALAEKVALVIGNGAYESTVPLQNPGNDANDVAIALEEAGFAVTRQLDLDQLSLLKTLQDFKNRATGAEVAVIYYAGHGIEIGRQNYLIPVDAQLERDTDIPFEAIPLEAAMQAVSGAADLSLVIVDACRNNPFLTTIARTDSTRSINRGLALVEPQGNTLVAYAAREGTVALDGDGRNSPYASALVSALREPGLEIGKLFRQVRDSVLETTGGAQEPFVYGSLSAKEIFLNPAVVTPAVAPAPAVANVAADPSQATLELALWNFVANSRNPEDFRDFLAQFPDGRFASFATRRIDALEAEGDADGQSSETRLLALAETPAAEAPKTPQPEVSTGDDGTNAVIVPLPVPEVPFSPNRADIRLVQGSLNALGHDAGVTDGLIGGRTRAAIRAFEARQNMDVTGEISAGLMAALAERMAFLGLEPVNPAPVVAAPEPSAPAANPQTSTAAVAPPQPQPTRVAAVSTGIFCIHERRSNALREQDCVEIQQVTPTTVTFARMTLLIKDGRRVRRNAETVARTATGFGTVDVLSSTRIRFRSRFYDVGNALF